MRMKKISIALVIVMVVSILPISTVMASSTMQSSIFSGKTASMEYDDIYYKVAARFYQDYINGVEETVIGLKGVDFQYIDPVTGADRINTLLGDIDGLCTSMKVKKVGDVTKITATYYTIDEWKNTPELDEELDKLIEGASKYTSVRDKLGYINDEIVRVSRYDYDRKNTITYTAQGALVNNLAVCEGYANAVEEICKRLGIKESMLGGDNHKSNMVYIDGQWYLWDLTYNVCNTNRFGEEILHYAERTDSGIEWTYGLAERQYFLIPLTGGRIERYLKDAKTSDKNLGEYEAALAYKYPEMSKLNLDLSDIEVDVSDIVDDDKKPSGTINIPIPSEQPDYRVDKPVQPESDYEEYIIDSEGNVTVKKVIGSKVQAKPTSSTVLVNNKKQAFEAYNINGNNYFKLRDIAMVITGTVKQFEVGWDGKNNAISLTTGKPYTSNRSELKISANPTNKEATKTTSKVYLDGRLLNLTAYNIGGNNYFMLRDLGKVIDFNVTWDGQKNSILIDTSSKYIG